MRKVNLNMKENNKYKIIKHLVDTNSNKYAAALKLQLSIRQINRLIKGYKEFGKSFFKHKNCGKTPALKITDELKNKIITLYKTKYYHSTYKHFSELLFQNEHISISNVSLRAILKQAHLYSPRLRKATKRKWIKEFETQLEQKQTNRSKEAILHTLEKLCPNPHPKREKSKYFGEMIQMDACQFDFLENQSTLHLHLAIDDATGTVVGAYFDTQETLKGYYHVLNQILNQYGIPYSFLTDRRTVFEYTKLHTTPIEKDTHTQFSYACHQLGIEIKTTSIPQAKGKIEKLNHTFQLRLPIEMRIAGVKTIEEANTFLTHYIPMYNQRFALPSNHTKCVFEMQEDVSKNNYILSVRASRVIARDHSIQFEKKHYFPVDENRNPLYFKSATSCLVMKCLDGTMCATIDENIYLLSEINRNKLISHQIDFIPKVEMKKKKPYIPPMSHPWKKASFDRYIASKNQKQ